VIAIKTRVDTIVSQVEYSNTAQYVN